MTRNISFSLTKEQFRNRTKTVTRRLGWKNLKVGEILCGVEKAQGLKKGEKVIRMGLIRVVDVRQESLQKMIDDQDYGKTECEKEGFPTYMPFRFCLMFIRSHRMGWNGENFVAAFGVPITRIEYEYL